MFSDLCDAMGPHIHNNIDCYGELYKGPGFFSPENIVKDIVKGMTAASKRAEKVIPLMKPIYKFKDRSALTEVYGSPLPVDETSDRASFQ